MVVVEILEMVDVENHQRERRLCGDSHSAKRRCISSSNARRLASPVSESVRASVSKLRRSTGLGLDLLFRLNQPLL